MNQKIGKSIVITLIQRLAMAEKSIYQLTDTLPDACSCPDKASWINLDQFCYSYNEAIRMSYSDGQKYCQESITNYQHPGFMISFMGDENTLTRSWMSKFNDVLHRPIRKRTWSSALLVQAENPSIIEWSFPEEITTNFNFSATKTLSRLEKQNNFGTSECIYFDRQGKMSTSNCKNKRRVICQTQAICKPKVTLAVPSLMRLMDFLGYNQAISGHGCWCPKLLSTDLEYTSFLGLAYAEAKLGLPVSSPDFACRDWSVCHSCAQTKCPIEDANFFEAGRSARYFIEYDLTSKAYRCSEENSECQRERCECDLNFIRKTRVMDLEAAINRTPTLNDCKKVPKPAGSSRPVLQQRSGLQSGQVAESNTIEELKSCCKTGYATWAMMTAGECRRLE